MDLSRYHLKRDFNSTPEPQSEVEKPKKELIFVVQKHAASQLHYDFRLEMNGVLKSWAIPKGPSMNPEEKRLAILVEDHPYSYKDFEGTIPEGNYGAGNVIVWDRGTYTLSDDPNKTGLADGHFSFVLHGKKLKGEFALVQLKIKQKNAWLLIKKEDQYASAIDVLKADKSVISNLTLEEMAK